MATSRLHARRRAACAAAVLLSAATSVAQAATSIWVDTSSGYFSSAASWNNGVPLALDSAVFSADATYTVLFNSSTHSNYSASFTAGTVYFQAVTTDRPYTLTNSLYLNGGNLGLTTSGRAMELIADSVHIEHDSVLMVSRGNDLSFGSLNVGSVTGSGAGTLSVDGTSSVMTATGTTVIGLNGASGTVTLQNSASAALAELRLARSSVANSSGAFTLQSGATATAAAVYIGIVGTGNTGQSGTLTVTSPRSTFYQSTASPYVTSVGTTTNGAFGLHVTNSGSYYTAGDLSIYRTGTVSVSTGGLLNAVGNISINAGFLDLGADTSFVWSGGKTLSVTDGGRLHTSENFLTLSNATVNVWDSGSQFLADSAIDIRNNSFLSVASGGAVTGNYYLYFGAGGNGTGRVDGLGSSVSVIATYVGLNASGVLTLQNSASASLGNLQVASSAIANTKGTLSIQTGATATATYVRIGSDGGTGQYGTLTVTGAGSSVTQSTASAYYTRVGTAASGTFALNVLNGGTFRTGTGTFTIYPTGTVTVDSNAFLYANGDITVTGGLLSLGNADTFHWAAGKTMQVRDAGRFQSTYAYYTTPANATIYVLGTSSAFSSEDGINVTDGAALNLSAGGSFTTPSYLDVGAMGTGTFSATGAGTHFSAADNGSWWGNVGGFANIALSNSASGTLGAVNIGSHTGPGSALITVQSGATLATGSLAFLQIGGTASTTTATVTGSGSSWSIGGTGTLTLGHTSGPVHAATLEVTNGALFSTGTGLTTVYPTGYVHVAGATFSFNGNMDIDGGTFQMDYGSTFPWIVNRTLNVFNGGTYSSAVPIYMPGTTVHVSGAASKISCNQWIYFYGGSSLTVSSGGEFSGQLYMSDHALFDAAGGPTAIHASVTFIGYAGGLNNSMSFHHGVTGELGLLGVRVLEGTGNSYLTIDTGSALTVENAGVGNFGAVNQSGMIYLRDAGTRLTQASGRSLDIGAAGGSSGRFYITDGATFTQGSSSYNTGVSAQIGQGTTTIYPTGDLEIHSGGRAVLGTLTRQPGGSLYLGQGALGFAGNLEVSAAGLAGSTYLEIGSGLSLALSGTTSVPLGSAFTIAGAGEFSTGALDIQGTFAFTSGTLVLTRQNLVVGASATAGEFLVGPEYALESTQTLKLLKGLPSYATSGNATVQTEASLTLHGRLVADSLTNYGRIVVNDGQLTVSSSFINASTGYLFVDRNLAFTLNGSATNSGFIELGGGACLLSGTGDLYNAGTFTGTGRIAKPVLNQGTIDLNTGSLTFTSPLANTAAGLIIGSGTLRADAGLTNQGACNFSGGNTYIHGPVSFTATGRATVAANTTTFYGPVTLATGSLITVEQLSSVVFWGDVTGTSSNFAGSGTKYFEAGHAGIGLLATAGSTEVKTPAVLTATAIREASLTVCGSATVSPNGTPAGTSVLSALAIPGGKFDLTNNDLVVHSTPASLAADYAALQGYLLQAGASTGAWSGTLGLTSATAAAQFVSHSGHAFTALAMVKNADLPVPFNGDTRLFSGQAAGADSLLIKYTYTGDANLDGALSLDDYLLLDSSLRFGLNSKGWAGGDFNYDGLADYQDYALIDYVYLSQSGPLAAAAMIELHRQQFGEAYASALDRVETAVPEPGALALVVLGGSLLLRRSARAQKSCLGPRGEGLAPRPGS